MHCCLDAIPTKSHHQHLHIFSGGYLRCVMLCSGAGRYMCGQFLRTGTATPVYVCRLLSWTEMGTGIVNKIRGWMVCRAPIPKTRFRPLRVMCMSDTFHAQEVKLAGPITTASRATPVSANSQGTTRPNGFPPLFQSSSPPPASRACTWAHREYLRPHFP